MHLEKLEVKLSKRKEIYNSYTRLTRCSEVLQAVELMHCSLVDESALKV